MYTAFYGLDEKPFTLSPDPRYLFLSETHREVLGHLIYGIEQGEGFIAISGEVGTGKTTLCRTLLERLGSDSEVAFLFNPQLAPIELLRAINSEFGLATDGESITELTQHLNAFLVERNAAARRVLLIVDEAQTLSAETLEQIRLLSNLETSRSKLLQIVLLGQPELEQKLALTELRQLRQRITVWWQLGPMSAAETREYVQHRLRIAGAARALFSDAALAAVHRVSRGVPRVINVLCDRALLAGYGEHREQIDRPLVQRVAAEIGPSTRRTPSRPPRRRALQLATMVVLLLLGFYAGMSIAPPALAPDPPLALPDLPAVASSRPAMPDVLAAPQLPEKDDGVVVAPTSRRLLDLPIAAPADPPASRPARSDVLDTLLPTRSPAATTAAAVDAALRAWRLPAASPSPLLLADALTLLRERGLRALWIEDADLTALGAIDLPALVQLRAEGQRARWALLRSLGNGSVELQGLVPGESVRVPETAFRRRWTGQGYVIWRDFEVLPLTLDSGLEGAGVDWLQLALGDLGHLPGARSGRFDAATGLAVRDFQRRASLPVDGIVGPRTKIRLYQALPGYASPSLGAGTLDIATRP